MWRLSKSEVLSRSKFRGGYFTRRWRGIAQGCIVPYDQFGRFIVGYHCPPKFRRSQGRSLRQHRPGAQRQHHPSCNHHAHSNDPRQRRRGILRHCRYSHSIVRIGRQIYWGYDASKGEYADMIKAGIVDSLKAVRTGACGSGWCCESLDDEKGLHC